MGNSTSSTQSATQSSSNASNSRDAKTFGGTSFLEEAGAASLFKCGNPNVVLSPTGGENDKPYRIPIDNICARPEQICAVREWNNNVGGDCNTAGPFPSCVGGAEPLYPTKDQLSDPEDEFPSLREPTTKDHQEGDLISTGRMFARSMVKEIDDPGSLTMKEMVQREKRLLKHEQQLIDGAMPNVFGGVVPANIPTKSHTAASQAAPSKHRVTIGLCLSRYHPTLGHPKSVTRQTAFDFNELQDRAYKYVSSTDEHGWRAGGGEPGSKLYDNELNNSLSSYTSPDSPGGSSITSHVKDGTGGGSKIASPDTVHIPIIEVDAQSEAHVQLIVHALAKGEIFIPHMSIMPEALGVIGSSNPDLVVRFGCERNEDLPIEEWPNWCLEFMHNQLYDYFQPLGAIWNTRPFQITLAKGVKWKTVKHMNNYFSRCEMVINAWREKGPQYLDPELSYFDGGASPEEISRAHGIYLIRNGLPTNYFAPNFEPPYTTKMTRSLLANVINKSWNKVKRDWATEPLGNLTSANAIISKLFGCNDPTVLSHEDKKVIFTAIPPTTPERKQQSKSNNGHVEKTASMGEDTLVSAKSGNSKLSSKSLMDDCADVDSPERNPRNQNDEKPSTNADSAISVKSTSRQTNSQVSRTISESSSFVGSTSRSSIAEYSSKKEGSIAESHASASTRSTKLIEMQASSTTGSVASASTQRTSSSKLLEEEKLSASKEKSSQKALSIASSNHKTVPSKLSEEEKVHASKEVPSQKTPSVAGSVVSSTNQRGSNKTSEKDDDTKSKKANSKKSSSVAGSVVSSSSQKNSIEEADPSKDYTSKKASSVAGSAVSSSSNKSSSKSSEVLPKQHSSTADSSVTKSTASQSIVSKVDPKKSALDSSFISSSSFEQSFSDHFFTSSKEEQENKAMSPMKVNDTSLDTAKSTPLTNNKKRSSRLSKIRQERAGWSVKRDELAEKKDVPLFDAQQNLQHEVETNSAKSPSKNDRVQAIKVKGNSISPKHKKQASRLSKLSQERLGWSAKRDELSEKKTNCISSPKREKFGKGVNLDSPQNSLAYSVDESTFAFDPFGSNDESNDKQVKESLKHDRSIVRMSSSTSTSVDPVPSDEELFEIGWAKALDPKTGYYYYFTLDRSKTVWENPLSNTS